MGTKLKTLQFIHVFICLGLIVLYLFMGDWTYPDLSLQLKWDAFQIIVIIVIISALSVSIFTGQKLANIDHKLTEPEWFAIYQRWSLIRWASLEAVAIMIVFLVPKYTYFGVFIVAYIMFLRPHQKNFKQRF
jgi:hypothetical protein